MCSFHHVGFVVGSISQVGESFARSVGARWDRNIIHDPLQSAKVSFLRHLPLGPAIELLEPDGPNSPLQRFLDQRNGGLHHICYEVDSLEDQLKGSRSAGALIIKPPLPAPAFEGRRIAWVFTPQKLLIEYLERA